MSRYTIPRAVCRDVLRDVSRSAFGIGGERLYQVIEMLSATYTGSALTATIVSEYENDVSADFVVSSQSPPNSTVTVDGRTVTVVSDGTAAGGTMFAVLATGNTYRFRGTATVTSGAVTLRAGGTAAGEFTTINASGPIDVELVCQSGANADVVRSGACNVTIEITSIEKVVKTGAVPANQIGLEVYRFADTEPKGGTRGSELVAGGGYADDDVSATVFTHVSGNTFTVASDDGTPTASSANIATTGLYHRVVVENVSVTGTKGLTIAVNGVDVITDIQADFYFDVLAAGAAVAVTDSGAGTAVSADVYVYATTPAFYPNTFYAPYQNALSVGDSFVAGALISGSTSPGIQKYAPWFKIFTRGASGAGLAVIRANLVSEYAKLNPGFVFMQGGINDIIAAASDPSDDMVAEVELMFQEIGSTPGALFNVSDTTSVSAAKRAWIVNYNTKAQAKCIEYGKTYLDLYSTLSLVELTDGLHPGTIGNSRAGQLVASELPAVVTMLDVSDDGIICNSAATTKYSFDSSVLRSQNCGIELYAKPDGAAAGTIFTWGTTTDGLRIYYGGTYYQFYKYVGGVGTAVTVNLAVPNTGAKIQVRWSDTGYAADILEDGESAWKGWTENVGTDVNPTPPATFWLGSYNGTGSFFDGLVGGNIGNKYPKLKVFIAASGADLKQKMEAAR